ncbi:hypothetical protein ACNOYE_15000 [Nannocystaceae bacterium ST9]
MTRAPSRPANPTPERPSARRDLATFGFWLVLVVIALVEVLARPRFEVGELEALVPVEHRSVRGEPWLLLRVDEAARAEQAARIEKPSQVDPEQATESELDDEAILLEAGIALEEALGSERVPLAPPRSEIDRWLDAHALYLLPVSAHAALASKLGDANMLAEVQGLEARMSSPLFAATPEQPRRDPLNLRELTEREAGSFGHVDAPRDDAGAQVTASGDLLGRGGQLLLIQLRSTRSPAALRESIAAALVGMPIQFDLLGPEVRDEQAQLQLDAHARPLLIACFAALVLVLALVLRRLIPVVALVACLASVWLLLGWMLGSFDALGLAMLVVLLGFGCEAALELPKIGLRGWASKLVLASALLPLLLSPYPAWQRWAAIWALGYLAAAAILRGVLPAMLRLVHAHGPSWLGHDLDWRLPGFRLKPMPVLAVLVCLGLTIGGAWASTRLEHRPAHLQPLGLVELEPREAELRAAFFDPALVVEARTRAELGDPAAALDAASRDAAALATLVPDHARRIDSPGSFVLAKSELADRKTSLATLELHDRMTALHDLLADQGLRAEAFAEFVRGAADIGDLPSAQAALDGPLGPWIERYLSDDGSEIRSRVELVGTASIPASIDEATLAELPTLRGPAIAAIEDRREFDSRMGLLVLTGLWLIAFWVWIGTGSLAMALAVALVALASECGLLLALELLGQSTGPHLLPALLLVGAATGVAAGRSCRAVALDRPLVARGLLLAGLCQVVAGVALLTSSLPIWRELGLAIAIGCMLAAGLGMFTGPGIARLLAREAGK